jgi:long-chain acyl-CoA synthetase
VSTVDLSSAARTVAESVFLTAAADPERTALRYKVDGEWRAESFGTLAGRVRALAAGLAASGVAPGDRVCVLADTRPEWTYVSLALLAAGAVVVPIYPTSSVDDCRWIISDSGASTVFCDTAAQREKALAAGAGSVLDMSALDLTATDESTVDERLAAIRPSDLAVIIYTSGTTGPPKGCMLTHQNWLTVVRVNDELSYVTRDDVVYLFLPLAHVFAQLVQYGAVYSGATLAYFGGDVRRVVPELAEVRPTFLPSVPRVFEKLYTALASTVDSAVLAAAVRGGLAVRRGEPAADADTAAYAAAEPLFAKVRAVFGGRLRMALSGAAPIPLAVLEFFYAAGVPVLEGYGMTETAAVGTVSTVARHRLGTVGVAAPGVTVKLAEDGEILMSGPHVFVGYWNNPTATAESIVDGWVHTGDLGAVDGDGYVTITGRKKDIIITAGGKNIAPANLENDLRESRWISQAVVVGDRRPYVTALVTLDPDEIVPWAGERGLPGDTAVLADHPQVRELVQGVVDAVNAKYARVEQIKRFAVLPHDLSQETGELTPTLKIKRSVVHANHAAAIESLYENG